MRTIAGIIGFLFLLGLLIQIAQALLLIAAVVAGLAVAVAVLYLLVRAAELVVERRRRIDQERTDARLGLIYRATQEHAWCLAGDPRGVFGQFPPAAI